MEEEHTEVSPLKEWHCVLRDAIIGTFICAVPLAFVIVAETGKQTTSHQSSNENVLFLGPVVVCLAITVFCGSGLG